MYKLVILDIGLSVAVCIHACVECCLKIYNYFNVIKFIYNFNIFDDTNVTIFNGGIIVNIHHHCYH